jgi:hypothetical protein
LSTPCIRATSDTVYRAGHIRSDTLVVDELAGSSRNDALGGTDDTATPERR